MKKQHKNTIIGLITISILLLSTIIFIIYKYYNDISTISQVEPNNFSRYVSDDQEDQESLAEEITVDDNINEEKQGELEEDTTRKVLNVTTELTEQDKSSLEEEYNIDFIEEESNNGVYVVKVKEDSNIEGLQQEDSIENLETDIPIKMFADTVDWGISRIGADSIWTKSTGTGIKVAVIDTGIQTDHPDLSSNIVNGYDFVNDDSNAYDDNGHGTHVAGIIAATQNGSGTIGASYTAKLMPIKVLNSSGYGYLSDVAQGIYYATNNGARIINLSLGAPVDSYTLRNAVQYAANKGVLIVAAAGNDGGAPCSYPAAYSSAICVVATDSNNKLASFSNVGGELAAPGVSNYSTFLGNTYRYLSGTSMATPHVSGSAAAVMAACPTCSTSQIRITLRDTAIDLGAEGQDIIFGYGLVDLIAAIDSVLPEEEETTEEDPTTEEPTTDIPDEETSEDNSSNKVVKYEDQTVKIIEPETTTNKRYIHKSDENITLKFELTPNLENSGLEKTVVSIDNKVVYTTQKQEDEYEIEIETLDHSQHWIRITSYFKDGKRSHNAIIVDMTYLTTDSLSTNRGKSKNVLGISTSIFDFANSIFSF